MILVKCALMRGKGSANEGGCDGARQASCMRTQYYEA